MIRTGDTNNPPLSPTSEFALEMWRKGYAAGKEDARLLGAFAAEAAAVSP